MNFFRKAGNAFVRFMYGRNGMDQLNLAMIWASVIVDVLAMLLGRVSVVAGAILYYVALAMWVCVIFRMFSKNLYKRRDENSKYLSLIWRVKNDGSGARTRHADKEHKYFTCKNCKTICRVPAGKGKVMITCPKCGTKMQGKT